MIHGLANHVVCVFADAPLRQGPRRRRRVRDDGTQRAAVRAWAGLYSAFGLFGVNAHYALAARRHMAMYGTTNDHFGAIAVAERQWAAMNPLAEHRDPITMEDYHASRWVAEPLHLLDCCLVSNGGVAVIVSRADEARNLRAAAGVHLGHGAGPPGRHAPQRLGRRDADGRADVEGEGVRAWPASGVRGCRRRCRRTTATRTRCS